MSVILSNQINSIHVCNFALTVTKFCVMWALPHDTKFRNYRSKIVNTKYHNCKSKTVKSRMIYTWSLISDQANPVWSKQAAGPPVAPPLHVHRGHSGRHRHIPRAIEAAECTPDHPPRHGPPVRAGRLLSFLALAHGGRLLLESRRLGHLALVEQIDLVIQFATFLFQMFQFLGVLLLEAVKLVVQLQERRIEISK